MTFTNNKKKKKEDIWPEANQYISTKYFIQVIVHPIYISCIESYI